MEYRAAEAIAAYIVHTMKILRVAAKPKPWKAIHKAADDSLDKFQKALEKIFKKSYKAISQSKLQKALLDKNMKKAETALEPAIVKMQDELDAELPDLLTEVYQAGGDAAAKNLNRLLGLRAAAPKKDKVVVEAEFDVTNPSSVKWIKSHALKLVDDLSKTTVDELRAILLDGFENGKDVDTMTKEIAEVIDDPARAELIARTETMEAANEGQLDLWDQAVEDGLLTGKERRVWIVTDDDRLCPFCEELDGEEADLDGEYPGDGGDGPPLHPNCRCTEGLVL